jgi:hypothetical protein
MKELVQEKKWTEILFIEHLNTISGGLSGVVCGVGSYAFYSWHKLKSLMTTSQFFSPLQYFLCGKNLNTTHLASPLYRL